MMMYVFFSVEEVWKSNDLMELKDFVNRHFGIETYWMELEVGEKVAFSECRNYSFERCRSDLKCLHQISMIGERKRTLESQN